MSGKTEWFTSKQKPVRPGVYECVIELLGCDFTLLSKWRTDSGWIIKSPPIKKWRGLTVDEYKKRLAKVSTKVGE